MKPHTTPPQIPTPQVDIAECIAQECLAVRVRLLNRALTAIYDEALRPLGMTTGQLNVMVVVANRGADAERLASPWWPSAAPSRRRPWRGGSRWRSPP